LAIFSIQKGLSYLKKDREMQWLLARSYFMIDRLEKAAAVLKGMLRSNNASPAVYVNLGHILVRQGKQVAAIRMYRNALLIRKEYFPALFSLATLFHQTGSLDIAEEYYQSAVSALEDNPYVHYNMGLLFYETGDYILSIASFKKCLEIKPGFKAAENNLRFVSNARICFPNEGPEEEIGKINHYYWIGFGSAIVLVLFTIFQGWL